MWYVPLIFDFIGDFDELTKLRAVNKEFKFRITKRNINALKMTEKNKYVLDLVHDNLTYLDCAGMQINVLPELPKCKNLFYSYKAVEKIPNLPKMESIYCLFDLHTPYE